MPLKFNNVNSRTGINVDNCFAVISRYEGDMTSIRIAVDIYVNEEIYLQDMEPIGRETIQISISELAKSNIFSYIYDAVVNSPNLTQFSPSIRSYPFETEPTLHDPAVAAG